MSMIVKTVRGKVDIKLILQPDFVVSHIGTGLPPLSAMITQKVLVNDFQKVYHLGINLTVVDKDRGTDL
jgi:hypothetical protein